jgi:hypothetical protein
MPQMLVTQPDRQNHRRDPNRALRAQAHGFPREHVFRNVARPPGKPLFREFRFLARRRFASPRTWVGNEV